VDNFFLQWFAKTAADFLGLVNPPHPRRIYSVRGGTVIFFSKAKDRTPKIVSKL
jgi:hypothetical protein